MSSLGLLSLFCRVWLNSAEWVTWLTDTSLKNTIGSAQRTSLDSTDSVTEDLCQSIRYMTYLRHKFLKPTSGLACSLV